MNKREFFQRWWLTDHAGTNEQKLKRANDAWNFIEQACIDYPDDKFYDGDYILIENGTDFSSEKPYRLVSHEPGSYPGLWAFNDKSEPVHIFHSDGKRANQGIRITRCNAPYQDNSLALRAGNVIKIVGHSTLSQDKPFLVREKDGELFVEDDWNRRVVLINSRGERINRQLYISQIEKSIT